MLSCEINFGDPLNYHADKQPVTGSKQSYTQQNKNVFKFSSTWLQNTSHVYTDKFRLAKKGHLQAPTYNINKCLCSISNILNLVSISAITTSSNCNKKTVKMLNNTVITP